MDLAEETRAVRDRFDAEDVGERLAEVGEGAPSAEIRVRAHARASDDERDLFA